MALALDGSGDVFVGGFFTHAQDRLSKGIARLHSDGSVDTAFAVAAKLGGFPYVVTAANDGSGDLYVGGSLTGYDGQASANLVRVNPDGSYDSGFVVGTGFDGDVLSVVAMNDGSGDILVAGSFSSYNGTPAFGVIKLNSDGSIDGGFAVDTGTQKMVRALALANDGSGKVYVGGTFPNYGSSTLDNVVRLHSNGTVDSGFAVANGGISGVLYAVCPAPDGLGDVYFGGNLSFNTATTTLHGLIRMNSDGSLDGGFIPAGFGNLVTSIVPASGGNIYVGGDFSFAALRVARVLPNGSVDPSFVSGTGFPLNCYVRCLAAVPSGGLYAGGDFYAYRSSGALGLVRILPDGDPDPQFRTGAGTNGEINALAKVGDGGDDLYVGGGFDFYNGAASRGVARARSDGTANTTLSVGSGVSNYVLAIASAADGTGDVYLAGNIWSYNGTFPGFILRLHANGTRDAGFAASFSNDVTALCAVTDGGGDVVVGGFFASYNGSSVPALLRLNANGSLDPGFSSGTGPAIGSSLAITAIVPAPDGSGDLYVGGDFSSYNGAPAPRIVRLNSNGTLDAGFAMGAGFDQPVRAILPASDGSDDIYVGGDFTTYQGSPAVRIVRLSSTGARVASFAVGSGFNGTVRALAAATDGTGEIYAGGAFDQYQGATAGRIARLQPDGAPAPLFQSGSGFSHEVRALVSERDGKVYVGGTFLWYKESVADRLVRLNSAGDLD